MGCLIYSEFMLLEMVTQFFIGKALDLIKQRCFSYLNLRLVQSLYMKVLYIKRYILLFIFCSKLFEIVEIIIKVQKYLQAAVTVAGHLFSPPDPNLLQSTYIIGLLLAVVKAISCETETYITSICIACGNFLYVLECWWWIGCLSK